jgi:hypothetical protein
MDYLSVTKKEKTQENEKEKKKPGWVYITKDPNPKKNNNILYEYKTQKTIPKPITLQPLIDHWKRRKEEYIELYGEDIYEEMFLCKNYDYDYFERLDREQEERMEQQKRNENSDYEYDYEYE